MERQTELILDDFSLGERVYIKGYSNSLRSMTTPYFGTVKGIHKDISTPDMKVRLDTGESIYVTFPMNPGKIGKVLPLKSVEAGDTVSHLSLSGTRLFYTVIEHRPYERMILEAHEPAPLLDGKKPLTIILRDYSTASLEDEFMDWELEG